MGALEETCNRGGEANISFRDPSGDFPHLFASPVSSRTPESPPVVIMSSARSTKHRVPASLGPATEESGPRSRSIVGHLPRQPSLSFSPPPVDGPPEFHASHSITASSTESNPRIGISQRVDSLHKRARAASESSQDLLPAAEGK